MNSNPDGAGAGFENQLSLKQHQRQNESNEWLNIK